MFSKLSDLDLYLSVNIFGGVPLLITYLRDSLTELLLVGFSNFSSDKYFNGQFEISIAQSAAERY